MKKLIAILIITLLFPVFAFSGENKEDKRKWTKLNTAMFVTETVLKTIDWSQTRKIAKNPEIWREKNPILDDHPSVRAVDTYFATTFVASAIITYALPHPYREIFQVLQIGGSGYCVMLNFHVGLRGGDIFRW